MSLKILTYNTAKRPNVIHGLLNDIQNISKYDFLIIQEPPKTLITNASWIPLLPAVNSPTLQARTLIYVNIKIDASTYNQIQIPNTRDAIALDLNTTTKEIRIINIYNPPNIKWNNSPIPLITPLLDLPTTDHLLHLSGDFNLHHHLWEPEHSLTIKEEAENLADLITTNNLSLLLQPGTMTFNNTKSSTAIDLIIGNDNSKDLVIKCSTSSAMDKGSDHLPIHTELNLTPPPLDKEDRHNFNKIDVEKLIATYLTQIKSTPTPLLSEEDIDNEVEALELAIQHSIKIAVPLLRSSPRAVVWWKPELTNLIERCRITSTYFYSHRNDPLARLKFKNAMKAKKGAIKVAKNQYWKKSLEEVNDKTLWKAVKSANNNSTSTSIPPLIKPDKTFALSLSEKTLLLKQTLLPTKEKNTSTYQTSTSTPQFTSGIEDNNVVNVVDSNSSEFEEGESFDNMLLISKKKKEKFNFPKSNFLAAGQNIISNVSNYKVNDNTEGVKGLQVSPFYLYAAPEFPSTKLEKDREKSTPESINSPPPPNLDPNSIPREEKDRSVSRKETTERNGKEGEGEEEEEADEEDLPETIEDIIPSKTSLSSKTSKSYLRERKGLKVSTPIKYADSKSTTTILDSRKVNLPELLFVPLRSPALNYPQPTSSTSQTLPSPLNALATPFTPKTPDARSSSTSKNGIETVDDEAFTSTPKASTPAPPIPPRKPVSSNPKYDKSTKEWMRLTEAEVKEGIFSSKSSSAGGPDKIPNSILKALWPAIGARVTNLYRACVKVGYHPRSWKEILAIVLRKPNKEDYSLPKSYRMIALIKTIAKGLENVMQKRFAFIAERNFLLPNQHMGGRPGRSCQDTLLLLTSTIHDKWREGNVVIGVALDAKAAFPSVVKEKLFRNLRRVGIPNQMVKWIGSFLDDRTCYLIVEGIKSGKMSANCGLPQGSPISPYLYLFYIGPLLNKLQSANSLGVGYIDDQFTLVWGKTIEEAAAKLTELIPSIEAWCKDHETNMEGDKSKIIVFTKRLTPQVLPPIILNGAQIPVVSSIGILGGTLNEKLTFTDLAKRSAMKALQAIGGINSLTKSTKGLSFKAARQLMISCVLPKLDYLSPLWFNKLTSNSIIPSFDKVLRTSCKLITGGLHGAGVDTLAFEANLLPTLLRLHRNSFRAATRLLSLPPSHPLSPFIAKARSKPSTRHINSVQQLISPFDSLKLPLVVETIYPSLISPWEKGIQPFTYIAEDKEKAIQTHNSILINSPPNSLFIYSDGSLLNDSAGAGMAMGLKEKSGEIISWSSESSGLGHQQTVYVGELKGIDLGLTSALQLLPSLPNIKRIIYLFIDNQSAVGGACNPIKGPGQQLRQSNRVLWKELTSKHPKVTLKIYWVPGHVEIEGNERADVAAKLGAELKWEDVGGDGLGDLDLAKLKRGKYEGSEVASKMGKEEVRNLLKARSGFHLPKSISSLNADYNQQLKLQYNIRWTTRSYKVNGVKKIFGKLLKDIDKAPPGLHRIRFHSNLNRRQSSILTQLRTGFSHLNSHLYKIKLADSPLCDCGQIETRHHFFLACPIYSILRKQLRSTVGDDSFNLCTLLTDTKCTIPVLHFINQTDRFSKYYQTIPIRT